MLIFACLLTVEFSLIGPTALKTVFSFLVPCLHIPLRMTQFTLSQDKA